MGCWQNVADINTKKYVIYCFQSMINACNLRHNNKYVKCADYTHIPHTTEITSYIGWSSNKILKI